MKKNLVNSLVELTNIEVVMNREQFLMYKHGEMTLAEIKLMGEVGEDFFNKIDRDKIFRGNVVFGMAFFLMLLNTNVAFASTVADPLSKIDSLGNQILSIIQTAGYWLCLICCGVAVIRAILSGKDKKKVGEIIIGFILAFSALYFMPWLFDLVKVSFGR